ncbi:MAG: hypothetical protein JSR37_03335 [Verrucomicrobia bacterium]|nr:hypothetical protein [Verrucomicrobiota bacterium]MBS0637242.1 hypothetical protein [Verrucomicrobiota bacterium]
MNSFWNDLYYEDIHFRDNLQFELESDFAPIPNVEQNISTQEFYFFIPAALQIDSFTYSKEQFYKDRTNLIRYKTPEFSFHDLINKTNQQSPLIRIDGMKTACLTDDTIRVIQDELKLLGNIVRSALRMGVRALLQRLETGDSNLQEATVAFCKDVTAFREAFLDVQEECLIHWAGDPSETFMYVDEFISSAIEYYFTGYLEYIRASKLENINDIDQEICEIIVKEKQYRHQHYHEPEERPDDDPGAREKILYHKGLLNKYVLDALMLNLERTSWVERYGNLAAGLAAGIAMLIYVLLIFLNVPNMGFNSLPFLLFTVVIYVLKDRIKDSLKALFHRHAVQWFSDYTTQVRSSNGEKVLGKLKEIFSFVSEDAVPEDIRHIRETVFNTDVRFFKRPEKVFYYKKEMELKTGEEIIRSRRHKLHNVFLFNIHPILEKASNPFESYLNLDSDTMEIRQEVLPKVYHLNIVIKNTYSISSLKKKITLKKFRLIIDKTGIKRVETVDV